MKGVKIFLIASALLLVGADIALRLAGVDDFPLYRTDPEIGYVVAPDQRGSFLNRNRWEYNEYGMGAGPFQPEGRRNLLLIGDSIVLGGNPLDQSVRLGPVLERNLGPNWAVWPIAAQGWSSLNKEAWLKQHPEIVSKMEWLVWVMKSSDFQGLSIWQSNLFNPLHHPIWLAGYLFEKQCWVFRIAPRLPLWLHLYQPAAFDGIPLNAKIPEIEDFLRNLKQTNPNLHILLVWYPEVAELHPPLGDFYLQAGAGWNAFAGQEGLSFVDLGRESSWSAADYRDQIHPNADGDRALAAILQRIIGQASANGDTPPAETPAPAAPPTNPAP